MGQESEEAGEQMKRVAVYVRVSTADQNADLQRTELAEYCAFRKWEIVSVYSDVMSGSKDRRPALNQLMVDAKRGKFDAVAVWKFDRFARSTRFLLEALEVFNSLGIDFVSLQENIDTSTSIGKALFTIISAIAELERATIVERVRAGQRAAKRRGVEFGRPTRDVDPAEVAKLRAEGKSWRAIAAQLDIAKNTLIRHCASA